jgi:hypothetical protein
VREARAHDARGALKAEYGTMREFAPRCILTPLPRRAGCPPPLPGYDRGVWYQDRVDDAHAPATFSVLAALVRARRTRSRPARAPAHKSLATR